MNAAYRLLLNAALLLALVVVSLGAYVRLSEAGLGCPDWPGCYGKLVGVPGSAHELAEARAAFPKQTVEAPKAWKEMIHRYAAASLGLFIAVLALLAWRQRRQRSPWPEFALLLVVGMQAALGMLTVTQLLKPAIVTAHLLGGMSTLALLLWLRQRPTGHPGQHERIPASLSAHAFVAVVMVFAQIALGGWVSSHYAAAICADFPTCQGQWWPAMDTARAFSLATDADALSTAALTAMHWTHRLFALGVLIVVGSFALRLAERDASRSMGLALLAALTLQLSLGIANVLLHWPLPLAVAHNTGAALLLCLTLAASRRLSAASRH